MPSITDLSYTNNMESNKKPFLTDLVETLDSVQTYINDSVKDNLLQLALDSYPAAYAFDSDGLAQYTNNLYDKLTATDSYTGGDLTISTTGAWTDLDAINAAITLTPELAGDFKVTFQFILESVTSNATNETDIRFRLTDSTTASTFTPRAKLITAASGTTTAVPVSLSYVYDAWIAAAKTVKLQYYITTATATVIKVYANTNVPLVMDAEKV